MRVICTGQFYLLHDKVVSDDSGLIREVNIVHLNYS